MVWANHLQVKVSSGTTPGKSGGQVAGTGIAALEGTEVGVDAIGAEDGALAAMVGAEEGALVAPVLGAKVARRLPVVGAKEDAAVEIGEGAEVAAREGAAVAARVGAVVET